MQPGCFHRGVGWDREVEEEVEGGGPGYLKRRVLSYLPVGVVGVVVVVVVIVALILAVVVILIAITIIMVIGARHHVCRCV